MRNPYFFGLGNGPISIDRRNAIDDIAQGWDAELVCFNDPASGPRYWMQCPDRGSPSNEVTASEVIQHLRDANLWPPS